MFMQGSTALCQFNITNESGPIDLTGATVYISIKKDRFAAPIKKICDITNTSGVCQVKLSSNELDIAGQYQYQLIIQYSEAEIIKSNINTFFVEDSLGDE